MRVGTLPPVSAYRNRWRTREPTFRFFDIAIRPPICHHILRKTDPFPLFSPIGRCRFLSSFFNTRLRSCFSFTGLHLTSWSFPEASTPPHIGQPSPHRFSITAGCFSRPKRLSGKLASFVRRMLTPCSRQHRADAPPTMRRSVSLIQMRIPLPVSRRPRGGGSR